MLSLLDWIIFVLLVVIAFYGVWFYSKSKMKDDPKYVYLPYGYLIKVLGGAFFAAIFFYVYTVGDTFLYWSGAKNISNYFWENPQMYFKMLFSNPEEMKEMIPGIHREVAYTRTEEEWFMVRILSVINIFCGGNYLLLLFFTSMFSFVGSWTIFEVINSWFKNNTRLAFICSFAVPTVIIWSSGVIKDSLVFGMIGVMVYAFYQIFFHKNWGNIWMWALFIISTYTIFRLKSYLVIALLPSLMLAYYIFIRSRIQNIILKRISGPILFAFMIGAGVLLIQTLAEISEKYEVEKLENKAKGFHTWHVTTGGATYNLGEIEYTISGVARKIPAALNVSFYRPYPWEIKNIGMAIASVESLILLLLSIYLLFYKGIKSIRKIFRDPLLTFFLIFSIILGFAAGFTSYNFGALVRYKMPLMPFFVFTLLYMAKIKYKRQLS